MSISIGFLTRKVSASITLALVTAAPLLAQTATRITVAGTAFTAVGAGSKGVKMEDVGQGRRFRGEAFSKVTLRAVVPVPAATLVQPQVGRIAVHFRGSPNGPRLVRVKFDNAFSLETSLHGDYLTREIVSPASSANAWDMKSNPLGVRGQMVVQLELQFPGGFDSKVDAGDFIVQSVLLDMPRNMSTLSSTKVNPAVAGAVKKTP